MKKTKLMIAIITSSMLIACSSNPSNKDIKKSEDVLLQENNLPMVISGNSVETAKLGILTEGGYTSFNDLNISEIEKTDVLINNIVNFGFDQYTLNQESLKNVNKHIDFLKKNNTIKVIVEGHTDEKGEKSYNLNLGERRATTVKEFMVSQGILPERIETISLGESKPLNNSSTKEAWEQNRRAVFVYN